jgi:sugar lactone lactonase YvrE
MQPATTYKAGDATYKWAASFAIPEAEQGQDNRRTHGIACCPSNGNIVVYHQAKPAVLVFSPEGKLLKRWGDRFLGAHGMTLVVENGQEVLWLTDQGTSEVSKWTVDGKELMQIAKPPHPHYAKPDARYVPTWVAVDPKAGDVWVADGYGSSLVHRHDKNGKWISSIDGTETGALGRFSCPHGIGFNSKGELVVADRGNKRLQIYDRDGKFLRGVAGVFHSPCSFAFRGDLMLVPELSTGVKLVRGDSQVIADLGDNPGINAVKGWPNLAGTEHVKEGKFNSPHGACFTREGDILCAEWIVGGRVTLLKKA